MSFPRYPKYKPSGVEWLGDVPDHWGISLMKAVTEEVYEPNLGMRESNLLSLSYGRIVRKNIDSNEGLLPESFETYQIVRPGEIVFRPTDLQNDWTSLRTAIVEEKGIITSAYISVASRSLFPPYLHYLYRAYDHQKVFYSMGGGLRQSLKFSDLKNLPLLVPSPTEQSAIAAFLDRETAKIVELMAGQRRLIELLKEKRKAVISHTVTKGLNPDVPMKPSGIQWLGDVPEHWKVSRIKYVAGGFMYGTSMDCNSDDSGTPVLRIPNVKEGFVDLTDLKFANFSHDEEQKYILNDGDILVVRTNGNPDLVGKSALFRGEAKCMFASYLIKVRPLSNVLPEFLNLVMNAECTREMLTLSARTSAGNYNMNCEGLGQTPLVLPSLAEQLEILEGLKDCLSQLDALSTEAKRAIELLQERRTALISAAVTGKIDVRELS